MKWIDDKHINVNYMDECVTFYEPEVGITTYTNKYRTWHVYHMIKEGVCLCSANTPYMFYSDTYLIARILDKSELARTRRRITEHMDNERMEHYRQYTIKWMEENFN